MKTKKRLFKRVILYARSYRANQGIFETLNRVATMLRAHQFDVFLDIDTIDHFALDIPLLSRAEMDSSSDLICVIGGDGSMLSAARMAVGIHLPVIGINRGRLGFLTDISPAEIETELLEVLRGDYLEEERFLLTAHLHPEGEGFVSTALNDVVLSRGDDNHLIEFGVYVDDECVGHYRSDGLIISTPTGSTAYALSAGGPIMHPALNAIVLVPMFSHSLSSRPVVVDGDSRIVLRPSPHNIASLHLSTDGHASHLLKPGQEVIIKKNKNPLRLLHPKTYHYYDTLRYKLGWDANHQG